MKLTLRKSAWLDDWYVIERAEHDNTQHLESIGPNAMALRDSSRFSDADVEGDASEMLAIADAIEQRGRVRFRRCAVRVEGQVALFCSPRNSQHEGCCELAEADDLAALIRSTCKLPEPATAEPA